MTHNSLTPTRGLPAHTPAAFRASTGSMRAAAGLAAMALVGLQAWVLATQDKSEAPPVVCLSVVELPRVEIRGQRLQESSTLASVSGLRADAAVKLAF